MIGTLKSLPDNGRKNFGFIRAVGGEYFFHRVDFHGHWNDLVEDHSNEIEIKMKFEKADSDRGLRANNVRRVDGGNISDVEGEYPSRITE